MNRYLVWRESDYPRPLEVEATNPIAAVAVYLKSKSKGLGLGSYLVVLVSEVNRVRVKPKREVETTIEPYGHDFDED